MFLGGFFRAPVACALCLIDVVVLKAQAFILVALTKLVRFVPCVDMVSIRHQGRENERMFWECCMKRELLTLSLGLLVGTALSPAASAQQTTGVPGSPSSTTTIDGRQIPPPPAALGGTINLDALNSTPYWQ